jgi:hypothetical protein
METPATTEPVLYCVRNRQIRRSDVDFIKGMLEAMSPGSYAKHGSGGSRTAV